MGCWTEEKVWTAFWIQSTDCVCVCVCVFWRGSGKQRGDGQDTTDLNKVLRGSQSHLPLNPEKLHKHAGEEGTR